MKKIFILLVTIVLIIASTLIFIIYKYNVNSIIANIEKENNIKIELIDISELLYYPIISFSNNNININIKNYKTFINNAKINVSKNYSLNTPFIINLKAPILNLQGIIFRDIILSSSYKKNFIKIDEFKGNINEGTLLLKGQIHQNDGNRINLIGNFKNISLNNLLQQSEKARWDRVKIMISSKNFKISSIEKNVNGPAFINGNIPVFGSILLTATEQEKFAAAILSLLIEKTPQISPLSKSVNFLISNYANMPSSFNGILTVENNKIVADNIEIKNDEAKSILKGSYNFITNEINGNIFFYDEDDVYLEAKILGNINNPKILVGSKEFNNGQNLPPQDLKKLFEEGFGKLLNNLLGVND